MYAAPPGLADTKDRSKEPDEPVATVTAAHDLMQRQPGDDDAAAAFRAMLAGVTKTDDDDDDDEQANAFAFSNSSGAALQGTTVERSFSEHDGRSALEKAVGRKDGNSAALTLEQQVARFPQLKNAPMAKGMKGTDVQVNFKPLGTQLRNVQCLACGVWGHSRGDRECSKSGWDPFSRKVPLVAGSTLAEQAIDRNDEEKANKTEKRRRYSSDSDSDSSHERRRRKERKRRRKEKKERRRRLHSHDEPDQKRRHDDRDRRREHDKTERKKGSRYYSDSEHETTERAKGSRYSSDSE
jgi:CBF1 interacting corepressor